MDMFDGFVFLEEKKKSLIPILCQYDFLSALTAAFSITSWRKNRGAQESCLALNSAMVENTEWGRKTIFTPNDLEEFFQLLYPILKTTPYDDPVLPDFGEIKLNYRSKYYSVITGTGHTAPIFSALQFLEKISESACMDAYTDSLLCYSDYCIDFLKAKNTPINEDFSLHPQFESPTFDYYENVKDFMTEEKWTGLGTPLLSMLAAESNEIVRSHFFSFNDHYYPLFNPSLVIDYQTKILLTRPDRELHSIVISSLADRRGNHPTIDVLGDYDVIGLNTTQKRIFIIECKVLQPIGSVFEHSNQQKRFFTKEKFDEKFQKRIDYFSKVAMSFFANHGYDTEGFTINPYMVVNKVFSSYYKHVQFPIVTFDELKREIQL